MAFDPESLRKDFPVLQGKDAPVYFDNACMTLRPRQVVDALNKYYLEFPACAGRSTHALSRRVDEEVYNARKGVRRFIAAKKDREVVFLRNTTEGLNLVARSFPFEKGDVILSGDKEHNSNLLPWQLVAERKGLRHVIVPSDDVEGFSLEAFKEALDEHAPRLVALGHTANLDGSSVPMAEVGRLAKRAGAALVVDAAQVVPHRPVDVRDWKADFIAFSGHKMLGPSGIGVLYGSENAFGLLAQDTVGGETALDATYDGVTWEGLPHRFEAGLQHYAGIIGLGAAVQYLRGVGLERVHRHEVALNRIITDGLSQIPGFSLIGPADPARRGGIVSFNVKGLGAHDIAGLLDASKNIAIRSGMHCVHSWFNARKLSGSARASLYAYNTAREAEVFVDEVKGVAKMAR